MSVLKIGTRPSKLAVAQSTTIADRLIAAGQPCELVTISTSGDRSMAPVTQLGVGVFVSALRDALTAGEIDVAVHSFKDLPTAQPAGLRIAAVPQREDVRDALVTNGRVLGELGRGARIGTGSPRRGVQLYALGQGLEVLAFPCNQVRWPVVVGWSAHTCAAACPRLLLFWRATAMHASCCAPASRLSHPPAAHWCSLAPRSPAATRRSSPSLSARASRAPW